MLIFRAIHSRPLHYCSSELFPIETRSGVDHPEHRVVEYALLYNAAVESVAILVKEILCRFGKLFSFFSEGIRLKLWNPFPTARMLSIGHSGP